MEQAQERLSLLTANRNRRADFTSANVQLATESLDAERADLARRIEAADQRSGWLQDRLVAEEEALCRLCLALEHPGGASTMTKSPTTPGPGMCPTPSACVFPL